METEKKIKEPETELDTIMIGNIVVSSKDINECERIILKLIKDEDVLRVLCLFEKKNISSSVSYIDS